MPAAKPPGGTARGVVYVTGQGRLCPDCGQPPAGCRCRERRALPPGDGIVRISRQTQGRKGKGVTVITGVPLAGAALEALATELKKRCGSGGAVKDGTIEIQGDHRDTLRARLAERGWTVKG